MKERIKIGLCYFGEGTGEGNGAPSGAAERVAETSTPTDGVDKNRAGNEAERLAEDVAPCEVKAGAAETLTNTDEAGGGTAANEPTASADRLESDESEAEAGAAETSNPTDNADENRAAIASHYGELVRQSAALRAIYPSFNLREELRNPTFLRLTAPGSGISVEDAFYTVHRRELGAAALQVIAQRTAEKLSNAVISGSRRPIENGAVSRAASINTFDYRAATPSQREAFKKELRLRMARGEKVYPN